MVAFPVQLRIMAVVESVLSFGCLAVVLRRAANPPTPALYRRYVICGYQMWRWSSTAKVGVATSMFWSTGPVHTRWREDFQMLLLCLLKIKSADIGLLLFFTFSTFLQFFSVPLPRSKSTEHSVSRTTDATPGTTKD